MTDRNDYRTTHMLTQYIQHYLVNHHRVANITTVPLTDVFTLEPGCEEPTMDDIELVRFVAPDDRPYVFLQSYHHVVYLEEGELKALHWEEVVQPPRDADTDELQGELISILKKQILRQEDHRLSRRPDFVTARHLLDAFQAMEIVDDCYTNTFNATTERDAILGMTSIGLEISDDAEMIESGDGIEIEYWAKELYYLTQQEAMSILHQVGEMRNLVNNWEAQQFVAVGGTATSDNRFCLFPSCQATFTVRLYEIQLVVTIPTDMEMLWQPTTRMDWFNHIVLGAVQREVKDRAQARIRLMDNPASLRKMSTAKLQRLISEE